MAGEERCRRRFQGINPYLEGYLWPEVLTALATIVVGRCVHLVRPRYTMRIGVYVAHDLTPEAEIGIMYPDVEILRGGVAPVEPQASCRCSEGQPAALRRRRSRESPSLNPSRSH